MSIAAVIVEDYAEIRHLMRMVLSGHGAGVSVVGEASNGEEALQLIDRCDPQVVVLDQFMPGLTGLETAARIRRRRPDVAIVICSAYLDDELRSGADALGIEDLLAKDQLRLLPEVVRRAAGRDTTTAPGG